MKYETTFSLLIILVFAALLFGIHVGIGAGIDREAKKLVIDGEHLIHNSILYRRVQQ